MKENIDINKQKQLQAEINKSIIVEKPNFTKSEEEKAALAKAKAEWKESMKSKQDFSNKNYKYKTLCTA